MKKKKAIVENDTIVNVVICSDKEAKERGYIALPKGAGIGTKRVDGKWDIKEEIVEDDNDELTTEEAIEALMLDMNQRRLNQQDIPEKSDKALGKFLASKKNKAE